MNEIGFNFGAHVHCRDGQCGKLSKIVVVPDTLRVTHMIVEEGFLLTRARVFPLSTLERVEPEEVYLSFSSDDLTHYPEYKETYVEKPVEGQYSGQGLNDLQIAGAGGYDTGVATVKEKVREGISSELVVLAQSTPINNEEGTLGKLDQVVTDAETSEITSLVVRQGMVFTQHMTIPATGVEYLSEKEIFVTLTNAQVSQLAPSAEQVTTEERPSPEGSILSADSTLASEVAIALQADPRTRESVVEVICDRGVITLVGQVKDQQERQAVEEIAAQYSGAASVVNSLKTAT